MDEPLFSLQNLTYSYDGKTLIFDQFSFDVLKGETIFLTGPNGIGKTTLLQIIAGLLSNGHLTYRAYYKGNPIQLVAIRRYISYVTAEPPLFSKLTGYENIECFRLLWRLDRAYYQKVEAICHTLGMADWLALPVDQYSLGTLQKLHIAIALGRPVELYLMDEPFNSLDVTTRDILAEWIQTENRGASYIIASHVYQDKFPSARVLTLARPVRKEGIW